MQSVNVSADIVFHSKRVCCWCQATVAVMDFESVGSEEHLGKAVAEIMRTDLISTGWIPCIGKGLSSEKALSEQKLQKSGLIDDKSVVELGKLLGANLSSSVQS